MFEFTDEEKREVQKAFDMFKSPEGECYVKKEMADEIRRGITAQGLFFYAKDQIMQSEFHSNKKKEFVNKAIASIGKAYSFFPLPIYMYDMARLMEMNGKINDAKDAFRTFLELQDKFKPSQIQEVLLDVQQRNVEGAINCAKEKIK